MTRAVTVVEKVLAVGIVYKNHREFEFLCLVHCYKTDNARCGLLTAADNIGNFVLVFGVDKVNKVAAVIDDDVRACLDNARGVTVVLFIGSIVPSENVKSVVNERSRNIVLR